MIEIGDDSGIFSGILVEKQPNFLILLFVGFLNFVAAKIIFQSLNQ